MGRHFLKVIYLLVRLVMHLSGVIAWVLATLLKAKLHLIRFDRSTLNSWIAPWLNSVMEAYENIGDPIVKAPQSADRSQILLPHQWAPARIFDKALYPHEFKSTRCKSHHRVANFDPS